MFQVFQVFRVFQVFHFAFGPQNRPVLVQIRTNPANRWGVPVPYHGCGKHPKRQSTHLCGRVPTCLRCHTRSCLASYSRSCFFAEAALFSLLAQKRAIISVFLNERAVCRWVVFFYFFVVWGNCVYLCGEKKYLIL